MLMNFKILIYLLIALVFTSNSYAVKTYKKGKGPLNLSENTAHVLEYYFSGGQKESGLNQKKQIGILMLLLYQRMDIILVL